jgi:hypothetical protein
MSEGVTCVRICVTLHCSLHQANLSIFWWGWSSTQCMSLLGKLSHTLETDKKIMDPLPPRCRCPWAGDCGVPATSARTNRGCNTSNIDHRG